MTKKKAANTDNPLQRSNFASLLTYISEVVVKDSVVSRVFFF